MKMKGKGEREGGRMRVEMVRVEMVRVEIL